MLWFFTTFDDEELGHPVKYDAVKQYYVGLKTTKSETRKADLGKNGYLVGLKTWKGGLGKS